MSRARQEVYYEKSIMELAKVGKKERIRADEGAKEKRLDFDEVTKLAPQLQIMPSLGVELENSL